MEFEGGSITNGYCITALAIGEILIDWLMLLHCVGTETHWPILLLLNALPALVCNIVLPFMPESPRYLMLVQKQTKEAEKGESRHLIVILFIRLV